MLCICTHVIRGVSARAYRARHNFSLIFYRLGQAARTQPLHSGVQDGSGSHISYPQHTRIHTANGDKHTHMAAATRTTLKPPHDRRRSDDSAQSTLTPRTSIMHITITDHTDCINHPTPRHLTIVSVRTRQPWMFRKALRKALRPYVRSPGPYALRNLSLTLPYVRRAR